MLVQSTPLQDILDINPDLVDSIVKRNGFSVNDLKKLHVLCLDSMVNPSEYNGEEGYNPRASTTVLLTKEAVAFDAASTGVSVKSPQDPFSDVGFKVALSRAVKALNG